MFKNYFKTTWRNLTRNKMYSLINILGLAVGMTVVILIALWIWDEVTFNKSFANHASLAQVETILIDNDGKMESTDAVSMPIGNELRNKYGSDFKNIAMTSWNFDHVLAVDEKRVSEKGMWVEANFPVMFSFKMIKGNAHALNDPTSVLISASLAKLFFGNEDPLHKTIRLDNKDNYQVAGVFEDFAHNSSFQDVNYFLPWNKYITTAAWLQQSATEWNNHSFQCYLQVADHTDMDKLSEKIKNVAMAHKEAKTEGSEQAYIYPMDKWHLYSTFENGKPVGGLIQFVWMFALIGFFVLLLACINFMNLATARSEKRALEVGIRKTIGSGRRQLITQFLFESILITLISFILAVGLVTLFMPLFNRLADKQISLPWTSGISWLFACAFILLTGLLAGSYPALFLSSLKPIKVLKGTFRVGRLASLPRKILVVVQFSFSIALIIGTVIVFHQIQYARNRPIHYRSEGLITINMSTPELYRHYDALRADLIGTDMVDNMAESSSPTTDVWANQIGFNWAGKDPNSIPAFGTIGVTLDFGKTIGWEIKAGRDFSKDFATDSMAMIVNEAAVKQIGMKKDIVGQTIQFNDKNFTVIGVIKDMIMESPYTPVKPTIFFYNPEWANVITVALKKDIPVKTALARIETVFKKYDPAAPFSYTFNDEDYAHKFAAEQRIGSLATFFTILAIFISCLGLFGLASFVAEQRKKEIGVRKVLGASIYNLWHMLSKEFAWLILISCAIAIPVAWYFLHGWLQQYEYRTPMSIWVFILSGLSAFLISLLTISFQAIKAAMTNPVKSLRTE